MNFLSLVGVELKKIRRSKILLILLIPVIMMWIPSIINADMNFDLRGIPITPENNFFIQGFMGMVWFMIPASLVICTVLLNQTERSNKGILKMLSLPISTTKLCLAKFTVLILLAAFQMVMSIGAYYICAAIVKGVGTQYILFAVNEPKLFQLLFMTEQKQIPDLSGVLPLIDESYEQILLSIQDDYKICKAAGKKLYHHLWIYTHGIATLCATKMCRFTDEEISTMITEVCMSILKKLKEGENND